MHLSIEDMFIQTDTRDLGNNTVIYGDPLHGNESSILDRYSGSLDHFLSHEARHSIGNYATTEKSDNFCRIITSPGYCGGYFHAADGLAVAGTTLVSVLSCVPEIAFDPFGLSLYLTPQPKTAWSQLPISTVFKGVRRIPPASVIEIRSGQVTAFYSYLLRSNEAPPASFADAIMEVADALSRHYKGKTPTLLFSGGVDSLALYLALAQAMDPKDIRVVTFQTAGGRSTANGPARAYPIASRLGMNVEYLPDNSLTSERVAATTRGMMAKDLIGTRSPHLALADYSFSADILHGQNMDATVMLSMTVLQANWERGILSKGQHPLVTDDAKRMSQYSTFIGNLQFTSAYLSDAPFQRLSAHYFAKQTGNKPDPDPGAAGVLRGLLSSQYPNLLPYPKKPASIHSMVDGMDREVGLYRPYVGPDALKPETIAFMARYLTYSHIASKRLSTLPLDDGSRVQLLAMAAPILNCYAHKQRGLADSSQPKADIYAFVEKITGKPYSSLATQEGVDRQKFPTVQGRKEDRDIVTEGSSFSPANSRLLSVIEDKKTRRHVETLYQKKGVSREFLHLELLLEAASSGSPGQALVA